MQIKIRPYFTAGVALVGASVIAVAPLQPATADVVRPASHAVQLAAVPSPFEVYSEVAERTAENVANLAEAYFADPFPITSATIDNQLADLADAAAALEDGDGSAAFASLVDAGVEPLRIPGAWNAALEHKINTEYDAWAMFMVFGSAMAGFGAAFLALQDVFEAAAAFDLIGVVNAVVNIPALIIDGVLNGVIRIGAGFLPGGLLSTAYADGPVEALIELGKSTGDRLRSASPDASPAVEEPSDLSPADQELGALAVAGTTIQVQQEVDTAALAPADTADTIDDFVEATAQTLDQANQGLDPTPAGATDATGAMDTPVVDALPRRDAELDTADDAITAAADEADEALAAEDLDAEIAERLDAGTDLSDRNNAEPGQAPAMATADGTTEAPLDPRANAVTDDAASHDRGPVERPQLKAADDLA